MTPDMIAHHGTRITSTEADRLCMIGASSGAQPARDLVTHQKTSVHINGVHYWIAYHNGKYYSY